jgi:Sec-independent protein translocase protein TatA
MGRSLTEFKKGMDGLKSEWDDAIYSEPQDSIEQEDRESAPDNAFTPPPAEQEPTPEEAARGGA